MTQEEVPVSPTKPSSVGSSLSSSLSHATEMGGMGYSSPPVCSAPKALPQPLLTCMASGCVTYLWVQHCPLRCCCHSIPLSHQGFRAWPPASAHEGVSSTECPLWRPFWGDKSSTKVPSLPGAPPTHSRTLPAPYRTIPCSAGDTVGTTDPRWGGVWLHPGSIPPSHAGALEGSSPSPSLLHTRPHGKRIKVHGQARAGLAPRSAHLAPAQPQHRHPQSEATGPFPHHHDQWHPHPGVRGKKEPPSSLVLSVQTPTARSVRPQSKP